MLCTCLVRSMMTVSSAGVMLVMTKTVGTGMTSDRGLVTVTEMGTNVTEMKKLRSVIWLTTLGGMRCRSSAF